MNKIKRIVIRPSIALLVVMMIMCGVFVAGASNTGHKKVLVIGDSMTGWLADRLNAYGKKNGFEVMTVVWDGATTSKYASSTHLKNFINEHNPDGVVVCLGMNEMLGRNFDKTLSQPLNKLLNAIGDRELLWVGPPSWPGRGDGKAFNDYMKVKLGANKYFDSSHLQLPRQSKTNPHPTRVGMNKLVDEVMKWNTSHHALTLPGHVAPAAGEASRSKVFVYKKMKERF